MATLPVYIVVREPQHHFRQTLLQRQCYRYCQHHRWKEFPEVNGGEAAIVQQAIGSTHYMLLGLNCIPSETTTKWL